MELQEIKKGVDTRIGNRNESGRDKKKTDTVFFLLSGRDKCLGVRKTAWKYWSGLFVKMSRIVLAGFLGAEVPKDNIKTYPKCEGI